MYRTKPPFRADHVGSHPAHRAIKEARTSAEKGEITAAQLKAVEDQEIDKIVGKQEEVGLQARHRRRVPPLLVALRFLLGARRRREDRRCRHGIQFHGVETRPERYKITGKIDFPADHPMLEHFKYLKAHTKVVPKMMHPVADGDALPRGRDGDPEVGLSRPRRRIFADSAKAYGKAVQGVLRRRLPLPAVRRHRVGLSVLDRRDGGGARPRRRCRQPAADLCRTWSTRRSPRSPPT